MIKYSKHRMPSDAEFRAAYELMERSFPENEYRTLEGQYALFERENYVIYADADDSIGLKALICAHEFGGMRFIENFCVQPDIRGGGIGGHMLDEYKSLCADPVVLEVELPKTDIAKRRIGFYKRHGFKLCEKPYLMPALEPEDGPMPLKLMSTKEIGADFDDIRAGIYRHVYRVKNAHQAELIAKCKL